MDEHANLQTVQRSIRRFTLPNAHGTRRPVLVFGRDKRNALGSGGRLSGIVAMHPDYKDALEVLVKACRPLA